MRECVNGKSGDVGCSGPEEQTETCGTQVSLTVSIVLPNYMSPMIRYTQVHNSAKVYSYRISDPNDVHILCRLVH